jgi:hypothetical protein
MPIHDGGFNKKPKHVACIGKLNTVSEKLAVIDGPLFASSWMIT